jgi:Rad3-related DNA helicase
MWVSIRDSESIRYDQDQKIQYVSRLMAFHDAHDMGVLITPELVRGSDNFNDSFDNFLDKVVYWTTQIEIRHAQRLRPISTILKLTPEIRRQLHSYISKIRETISPMNLAEKKKEAILGKLTALADEIDRDRTKAEAWTAFTLEIAGVGGEAAKELKPVKELADAIANLLGKAKELAGDVLGLPSPTTRKRIEGPKKQLSPPETATKRPEDDEPPF